MAQDRFEAQAGTRAATTTAPSERPLWRRILLSRGLAMLGGLLLVALLLSRGLEALGGPEAVRTRFGWFGPVILLPSRLKPPLRRGDLTTGGWIDGSRGP